MTMAAAAVLLRRSLLRIPSADITATTTSPQIFNILMTAATTTTKQQQQYPHAQCVSLFSTTTDRGDDKTNKRNDNNYSTATSTTAGAAATPNNNISSSNTISLLRRLRRVPQRQAAGNGNNNDPSARFALRKNAITLFPGDFSDVDSIWHEDADEEQDFFDNDGTAQERVMTKIRQALREKDAAHAARKEKWLATAKPPVRVANIDNRGRAFGRGGRKAAKAQVWIQAGLGEISINGREMCDYFIRESDREHLLMPLVVTSAMGSFDVTARVGGGGSTGQAGAVRLGLANALQAYNPNLYRPPLKRLGLLTRDARKVERKKVGRVKARKSPQWVRR